MQICSLQTYIYQLNHDVKAQLIKPHGMTIKSVDRKYAENCLQTLAHGRS